MLIQTLIVQLGLIVGQTEQNAAPAQPVAAPQQVIETPPPQQQATVSAEPPPAQQAPTSEAPAAPQISADEDMTGFYKGELGTPGAPSLYNPYNAIFLDVGYFNLGGILGEHYLRLSPIVDLYFDVLKDKPLALHFQAPFSLLLYDVQNKGRQKGSLRKADYDEFGDFLKFISSVQLGRKEDNLYLHVGTLYGISIGHGAVVRRYNANIDPDRTRLGIQFDAYNDLGGFETFVADLAFQSRVVGALVFAKPFSLFSETLAGKTFSLGGHYTTDLKAPKALQRDNAGIVRTDDAGYPTFSSTTAQLIGVDMEVKPVRLGNAFDLKLYIDYSKLVDAGGGFTGGILLRSNLGVRPLLQAFRLRLEAHSFDNNYMPHYFDSLYEMQKLQYFQGEPKGNEPTKFQAITSRRGAPKRSSVYGEASYSWVDRLIVGVGLERLFLQQALYNFLVHVEIPAFEFLRLYASYQKFGYRKLGDSFALAENGKSLAPDAILASQLRLMLFPILFVNAGLQQSFQWDSARNAGSYKPKLDFLFSIQLGYEFGGPNDPTSH